MSLIHFCLGVVDRDELRNVHASINFSRMSEQILVESTERGRRGRGRPAVAVLD